MTHMAAVQAVVGYAAAESASTQQEVGTTEVRNTNSERKRLQQEIRNREAEVSKLQKELEQASDMDGWDHFCNFFTGGDNGVGELKDKLGTNSAEMKKAMNELKLAEAQIEQDLAKLEQAQQELSGNIDSRQRTYDESSQVQKEALA